MWDWISKPEPRLVAAVAAALLLPACAGAAAQRPDPALRDLGGECRGAQYDAAAGAVNRVLDELHAAAARADGKTYFSLYHPQARFVGTDASETWSVEAFKAYAEPHFSKGKGWKYEPGVRTVGVRGRDCTWAWFDEQLASESYGAARGSGALVRTTDGWKVEHYVLSFPIPNDLAKEFTARIKAHEAEPPPPAR
jgi:hypothetical protein